MTSLKGSPYRVASSASLKGSPYTKARCDRSPCGIRSPADRVARADRPPRSGQPAHLERTAVPRDRGRGPALDGVRARVDFSRVAGNRMGGVRRARGCARPAPPGVRTGAQRRAGVPARPRSAGWPLGRDRPGRRAVPRWPSVRPRSRSVRARVALRAAQHNPYRDRRSDARGLAPRARHAGGSACQAGGDRRAAADARFPRGRRRPGVRVAGGRHGPHRQR